MRGSVRQGAALGGSGGKLGGYGAGQHRASSLPPVQFLRLTDSGIVERYERTLGEGDWLSRADERRASLDALAGVRR